MRFISFMEISELKESLKNAGFNCAIHSHDTCGGQYFSLEADGAEVIEALKHVKEFFNRKNISVHIDEKANTFRPV